MYILSTAIVENSTKIIANFSDLSIICVFRIFIINSEWKSSRLIAKNSTIFKFYSSNSRLTDSVFFWCIKSKNNTNFNFKSGKLTSKLNITKKGETLKFEKFKITFVKITTGMVDEIHINCCLLRIKFKKKFQTTVQICRLENTEHKSMKQVSYSGKYSLSASRVHQSNLQFSFVVGNAFWPRFLHV